MKKKCADCGRLVKIPRIFVIWEDEKGTSSTPYCNYVCLKKKLDRAMGPTFFLGKDGKLLLMQKKQS